MRRGGPTPTQQSIGLSSRPPNPLMPSQAEGGEDIIASTEPKCFNNSCPSATALLPRIPTRNRIASSSASVNVCAPRDSRRSRGRSSSGHWAMPDLVRLDGMRASIARMQTRVKPPSPPCRKQRGTCGPLPKSGEGLGVRVIQIVLRYSRIISAAVAPSPTALAACLVLPKRTSPAANTPGSVVSRFIFVTTKPAGSR